MNRELPLYQHLKEMLPALGIAVFIYDRRGSGKSAWLHLGQQWSAARPSRSSPFPQDP